MKISSDMLPRLPAWNTRKWVSLAGYSGFFLFFFALFSYWSFPYGRVRDFLIRTVNDELGYQLSIGELAPHWFTGLHLTEIKLIRPAEDANSEPAELTLEEATVNASVFSFLLGKLSVSFWGSTGDGTIDGTYSQAGEAFDAEAELDALDLGVLGVGEWLGLPVRGQATGELALTMPEIGADPSIEGSITVSQLALGDGKAKLKLPALRDGITVERVDAGTLTLELESANGLATIKQFGAQGPDLKLKGQGTVRLARPLLRSRGDFSIGVTFTDKYKQRNDRTKALFQLMDFQPELKRATSDDGTLSFRLVGPLSSIRATPAGAPVEDDNARKPRVKRKRGT